MRVNHEGCVICGSTWGDIWNEVDGDRLFFCCEVCAVQFRHLMNRVKAQTGWDRIDTLEILGDRRGRTGLATHRGGKFRFFIAFNPQGEIREFEERPVPAE